MYAQIILIKMNVLLADIEHTDTSTFFCHACYEEKMYDRLFTRNSGKFFGLSLLMILPKSKVDLGLCLWENELNQT